MEGSDGSMPEGLRALGAKEIYRVTDGIAIGRCVAKPNPFALKMVQEAMAELKRVQDPVSLAQMISAALEVYRLAMFTSVMVPARLDPAAAHLSLLEMHRIHQSDTLASIQRDIEDFTANRARSAR